MQYDGINERTEMLTETWSILTLKRITLKVMMIEYMVDTTQKCINLCISSHGRNQESYYSLLYTVGVKQTILNFRACGVG